ncbi:hypothetical protein EXN66_Car009929 [Channa argus]|uniref:Uncharacterized protein n=1 Tax=Channa argus TaxID=215402 RepID=A0A6G1PVP5_CHAAH|nr:hypothetical protein EXN66_Car009929 [Channa argus]
MAAGRAPSRGVSLAGFWTYVGRQANLRNPQKQPDTVLETNDLSPNESFLDTELKWTTSFNISSRFPQKNNGLSHKEAAGVQVFH